MSKLEISGTRLLREMLNTDKRFILHVGGSRSGKTFSILQYILIYCLKNKFKVITIARKTFPSLRLGAYREFIEILKIYNLYKEENHNKTNNIYTINDNTIQFISIDQSQKLRGLKHDLVFIDEVNEVSKDESDQLFMRTNDRIIMAQNPSNALHWSLNYRENPECLYLHSTYKDNNFIPQSIVNQIESYKETDWDQWLVFGLGQPSKNNELVYNHAQSFTSEEELYIEDSDGNKHEQFENIIWGLDFGWNHPTALVKIWINSDKRIIWCKQIIHESFLTTDDLITKMKEIGDINGKIFCDSAEPKTIETIRRAGFEAVNSMKEVKEGIDMVKSFKFYIYHTSTKIFDETRRYKWKMKDEMKTDEPIKLFDDALCAIRYAVFTYMYKDKRTNDYDFDFEVIDY
jgi:phage terminase large subunit